MGMFKGRDRVRTAFLQLECCSTINKICLPRNAFNSGCAYRLHRKCYSSSTDLAD